MKKAVSLMNWRKISFVLLTGCISISLIFTGCKKDDKDDKIETNILKYNDKKISLIGGVQYYYGHYEGYSGNTNNVDLYLVSDDFMIFFEMFVPNGYDKLVEGTYTKKSNYQALSFLAGGVYDEYEDAEYEIASATVSVAVSGINYTIDVNADLRGGRTVTGNYTGSLVWMDETDTKSEFRKKTYPNSISILTSVPSPGEE